MKQNDYPTFFKPWPAPEDPVNEIGQIPQGVIYAEPIPYGIELKNDAKVTGFASELKAYQTQRNKWYNECAMQDEKAAESEAISAELASRVCLADCKVVNEIIKVQIINARISCLEEFEKYFQEIVKEIKTLPPLEQRKEYDALDKLFAVFK